MEQVTPAVDQAAIEQRAAQEAQRRVNEIFALGEDHADFGGIELARSAIKDGTSVADFQRQLLAAKRSPAPSVQFGAGARAKENIEDDPKRGFKTYGDFCADVVRAASGKQVSDVFQRAATTFAAEGTGPDGGYAVPPAFANEIASVAYAEESLLSRCDDMPISGNTMTFPKDETTPWGTTGIT